MRITRNTQWTLLAIFGLALLPRMALAWVFLAQPIGLDDMHQYDMLARSILEGRGYRWYQQADVRRLERYLEQYYRLDILPVDQIPEEGLITTFRAPGYPLFLAGVYGISGLEHRLAAARLVQAVLSAAMAPMTILLALRLGIRNRGAVLAGLAVAGYPMLWFYPLGLGSENLFIPLLLAGVLLLVHSSRPGSLSTVLLAGTCLGAATLTRGALVAFLPLAAVWLQRRSGWRSAWVFIGVLAVFTIPWSLRNSLILNRPSFLENSFGYNLFVGYHPLSDGGFQTQVAVIPLQFIEDVERDAWTTAQALGFIKEDPIRAAELTIRRLAYFWGLEGRELIYFYTNNFIGPLPPAVVFGTYLVVAIPWLLIAGCAIFGLFLIPGGGRQLTLGLIFASMAVYVPVLAEPRFHLPLVPFLAVYAAAAWTNPRFAWGLRSRLAVMDGKAWLAVLAIALMFCLWGWDVWRQWPRLALVFSEGANTLYLNY